MKRVFTIWKTGWAAMALLAGLAAPVARAETNVLRGRTFHLSFDTIEEGKTLDSVTSNMLGQTTNVRAITPGRVNAAAEMRGKNSFVLTPHSPAFNLERMTVSLWFRTGAQPAVNRTLFEKGGESGFGLFLMGHSPSAGEKKGRLRAVVNGVACLSDGNVVDTLWHHAAMTFDGRTLTLYVNGERQKQTATSPTGLRAMPQHDLTIGMNRSSPAPDEKEAGFDGALDEVMVFNRALSAEEIQQVRAMGRPRFTKREVERRLRELKELYDRGLLTEAFYKIRVAECEVAE